MCAGRAELLFCLSKLLHFCRSCCRQRRRCLSFFLCFPHLPFHFQVNGRRSSDPLEGNSTSLCQILVTKRFKLLGN